MTARFVIALSFVLAAGGLLLTAQAPAPAPSAAPQLHADLNQLMRGVLYPPANVMFSAQFDDPGDVKFVPGKDPSMATDPLLSTFGGWTAVENASLALAESANLLTLEGRKCSNGVVAPVKDPAWLAFVQDVRNASLQGYKAAQAKDRDKMIENSELLSNSCSGCHRKWRDRRAPENRCKQP